MRIPCGLALLSFFGVIAVVSCGGSPVTPSPRSASVSVTWPPGHAASIVPGEKISLVASLTSAEGAYSDCTAAAQWEPSSPGAAKFTEVPGQLVGVTGGSVSVFATCGGAKSAALTLTVSGGVKISGLEGFAFILPPFPGTQRGPALHLAARMVNANGVLGADCTRSGVWTTADPAVAIVDIYGDYAGDPSYLYSLGKGLTTVTVNCGGATGQISVRVQPIRVSGVVRDAQGQPVAGALVRVASDATWDAFGSDQPIEATTAADGSYFTDYFSDTACVRAYRADTSVDRTPCVSSGHTLTDIRIDATVARLSGMVIQEGSGVTCRQDSVDPRCPLSPYTNAPSYFTTPSFRPVVDGPLRISVEWPVAAQTFSASLSCGDGPHQTVQDYSGTLIFEMPVQRSDRCLVDFRVGFTKNAVPFTYRISQ